ncbi:MAG: hypothetical protein [Olavius algarvensis Gamma 1 endosymbiont]|nr:MAG: hypothetical protein [Olavius algarvensis Gamma 1 endosymbiont]
MPAGRASAHKSSIRQLVRRYTLLIPIFRFFIQPMSSKLGSGDF